MSAGWHRSGALDVCDPDLPGRTPGGSLAASAFWMLKCTADTEGNEVRIARAFVDDRQPDEQARWLFGLWEDASETLRDQTLAVAW
jgi:hypothetical protein